ncbi:DDE-type integrase/transposase/recombinase [Ixodes scapularis]
MEVVKSLAAPLKDSAACLVEKGSWKEALKNRTKNQRKMMVDITEVTEEGGKWAKVARSTSRTTARGLTQRCVATTLPSYAIGEDEASIEAHTEFLKKEMRKAAETRNQAMISDAMNRTSSKRREWILEKPRTVDEVLEMYPALDLKEEEHGQDRATYPVMRIDEDSSATTVVLEDHSFEENFGDNSTPWLLVIPTDLREEIFQACHDDPTSGHLGYSRTLARIREKYYWPKLPKTVHFYTRSCHECQRRKKPPTKPAGLLHPIAPPTVPFQQIGMDLLGPFPPSTQGNRWIIVATDYLTRYAETKALPVGTAVEVAKFFIESIVLRHGAPEVLISDRGSSFMAQLTQEILRLSHTSHRRTTAYHPQTNGLTERLNKTIADMISMYVDVEHKTWDEVLPYVTFAYNTAVQETTGVTPFQLVHGRKVTTMLDAMLPHEPAVDGSDDAQVVAQRAEEVRQLARLRIQAQQRVDTGRYNLRRRDVHFQPGDRVWVWTPIRRRGLSEKLLKRYFGPYKVLRRLGDLNYEVMPDGTRTSSRRPPRPEVVHVVRLKPYYAR